MGKFGGASMRILVHDRLKLFVGFGGALLGGGVAGKIRLGGSAGRPQWRIQHADGLVQQGAGFLVLLVQVVPAANSQRQYDGQNQASDDEL